MALKKVRSAFGGDDSDKHSALIDEFKMAHKKMFRNQNVDESATTEKTVVEKEQKVC